MAPIHHSRGSALVRGKLNGKRVERIFSKERYGTDYKEIAEKFHNKMLLEKLTGVPQDKITVKVEQIFMRYLTKQYREQHLLRRTKAGNNKSYLKIIDIHFGDYEMHPHLSLTTIEFRDWVWHALDHPVKTASGETLLKPSSIEKVITYASAVINWAIERDIIKGPNPLTKVKDDSLKKEFRRRKNEKDVYFTSEEFWAFINKSYIPELFRDPAIVMWCTGLRRGELCQLTFESIKDGIIRLHPSNTKEAHKKNVVIEKEGLEVIEKLQAKSKSKNGRVFLNSKGAPLSEKTFNAWWRIYADRYAEETGNVKFAEGTPHDIRHSFRTRMDIRGVSADIVKKQLGHHSQKMTEHYNVVNLERQRIIAGITYECTEEVEAAFRIIFDSGEKIDRLHALMDQLYTDFLRTKNSPE